MATATNRKRVMTSDDYKKEIVMIEKQMNELKAQNTELQKELVRYLNKKTANEFTKSMYTNEVTFNPKSLNVMSETFVKLSQKLEQFKHDYMSALREELIEDFIMENPKFKSQLKDIKIEQSSTGIHAQVMLK